MRCKDCPYMRYNWIKDRPDEPYCIGVKHPFKIEDINQECTEYVDDTFTNVPDWADLDLTCDNTQRPTFIMLVGVPGVGKSTYAKKLVKEVPNCVHISSDKIRLDLWNDENCQKEPDKVFTKMHEETLLALERGNSVIYDATSVKRKDRLSILSKLPKYVRKDCIVVWAPIEVCIERDKSRKERTVGETVITKMLKWFEAPFYDEGFDSIVVYTSDVHYNRKKYYEDTINSMKIPHDNPHHSAGVIEHCHLCGNELLDEAVPEIVVKAGYLHDIGKPYTKTFTNAKGEVTETAHYYGHQGVGAWISYGFFGNNITLAWLISTHMAPFINQKYYNSLPTCYKKWIDALHKADKGAH